jgi:hypothetical protein
VEPETGKLKIIASIRTKGKWETGAVIGGHQQKNIRDHRKKKHVFS